MSDPRPDVDLAALRRTPRAELPAPSAARRWRWRLVPLAVLLVFLALLGFHLRDLLTASVPVTVARPKALDAASEVARASRGTPLFQAAGWAEPEPFATEVSALRAGVVEQMLVVPAQRVEAGEVVARLIDADTRLALEDARAQLARTSAEADLRATEHALAVEDYDEALKLNEELRAAQAGLEGRRAASSFAAQAVVKGEAALRIAEDEVTVQEDLEQRGAAGLRQLDLARARVDEARGALAELHAQEALARAEEEVATARLDRMQREAQIRLEDRRRRDVARDALLVAQRAVESAKVAVAVAELAQERSEVRSPAAGFVLELRAMPGSVVAASTGAPLLTLYDPRSLRMRVDVLADDIAKVQVGQRAEVLTDARPDRPYEGRVLRVAERADIQKKTLAVHVAVEEGDAFLKPDLLGQVRFFATGLGSSNGGSSASNGDAAGDASGSSTVLVPTRLLDGTKVWIVREGRAHAQALELGERRGDLTEVRSGVDLSSKLIDRGREGLVEGTPVHVEGGER